MTYLSHPLPLHYNKGHKHTLNDNLILELP